MATQDVKSQVCSARPELTRTTMVETGLDEQVLRALVTRFYERVRRDAVLGPIFEGRISDWAPHLDRMTAFWSSVALATGRYHGRPVRAHVNLHVDATDFERWLVLFRSAAHETCTTRGAAHVIDCAERVARSLLIAVEQANAAPGSVPGLR